MAKLAMRVETVAMTNTNTWQLWHFDAGARTASPLMRATFTNLVIDRSM